MKKLMKNEKGLTLIELLAVIVILAIIAAIAIPMIGNLIQKSEEDGVKADAIRILEAAQLYQLENPNESSATFAVSGLSEYLQLTDDKLAGATVNFSSSELEIDTGNISAGKIKLNFTGATIMEINDDESGSGEDSGTPGVRTIGD
ncbi:prepilin-type N-terminal cleavage/methylation domain-containing protein [Salirhabdus salicampi]|uniref:prepilin-type N-terminal cleavage/methylation domain-containing protein n=1 Tax=Salirhabdus salicampi TaxID=476102 RepID=UPI0020C54C5B|nr:prepilin-type N-terminal cleavage/methylation domain-containing protein [Salirhabdus salicampi]MCP8617936.1 prepilin-type N-terminal cleavage/methylation domain-containing protein [Salirhabdus salicampi]